ncbi:MAG: SDR family oxidoreductase [Planctomycetia bacterium]|nr:SDR family oxidoreductase [Planctomycetia bacterium]
MKLRILVTGVSRGLGRAMVGRFAAQGHETIGCATTEAGIAPLKAKFGPPHRFDVVDVVDDAAVAAWATAVEAEARPFDLVINNAAVMNQPAPLWNVPAAELRKLVDVNILGTANVIRHFVPPMVHRRRGIIVNFSSGWGRSTSADVAPYCATKYAIEGLTLALAHELPKGMAAVPLNPGVIDTDMLRTCFGREAGSYPGPDRWADRAVPFILSLAAKHNGQSLSVPG